MGKRIKTLVGYMAALAAVSCGASPEDTGNPEEQAKSENVGTSSEALPCTNCDEGNEPPGYYPYDNECGTGESRWNSAAGCGPNQVCQAGLVGCGPTPFGRRCTSSCGCGGCTPTPTTNPCYGGYLGQPCTLSGGYTGHCAYDWSYQLACSP